MPNYIRHNGPPQFPTSHEKGEGAPDKLAYPGLPLLFHAEWGGNAPFRASPAHAGLALDVGNVPSSTQKLFPSKSIDPQGG